MTAAFVIEKLFWNSGLSSTGLLLMELPLIVVINALLWFVILAILGKWLGPRTARQSPGSDR